ncbi:hypothetical protein GH714_007492 [Hevea brasiliensis]|uniref:Uncharacterized protein n=1 Tax=Hevea brasiliensis TaxID=3981 RepID=A0A6A6K3T9_HEVBR|nr:hypothetical protein GH714_007492 [Hevea brasiliensis]
MHDKDAVCFITYSPWWGFIDRNGNFEYKGGEKWDENGDIHLFVEAIKENDSEGENQPGITHGQMQGTPKSKLSENDVISQNYEMVDEDGSIMGYSEENSARTPNDRDYDLIKDRVENANDELKNESFNEYLTNDSEF